MCCVRIASCFKYGRDASAVGVPYLKCGMLSSIAGGAGYMKPKHRMFCLV